MTGDGSFFPDLPSSTSRKTKSVLNSHPVLDFNGNKADFWLLFDDSEIHEKHESRPLRKPQKPSDAHQSLGGPQTGAVSKPGFSNTFVDASTKSSGFLRPNDDNDESLSDIRPNKNRASDSLDSEKKARLDRLIRAAYQDKKTKDLVRDKKRSRSPERRRSRSRERRSSERRRSPARDRRGSDRRRSRSREKRDRDRSRSRDRRDRKRLSPSSRRRDGRSRRSRSVSSSSSDGDSKGRSSNAVNPDFLKKFAEKLQEKSNKTPSKSLSSVRLSSRLEDTKYRRAETITPIVFSLKKTTIKSLPATTSFQKLEDQSVANVGLPKEKLVEPVKVSEPKAGSSSDTNKPNTPYPVPPALIPSSIPIPPPLTSAKQPQVPPALIPPPVSRQGQPVRVTDGVTLACAPALYKDGKKAPVSTAFIALPPAQAPSEVVSEPLPVVPQPSPLFSQPPPAVEISQPMKVPVITETHQSLAAQALEYAAMVQAHEPVTFGLAQQNMGLPPPGFDPLMSVPPGPPPALPNPGHQIRPGMDPSHFGHPHSFMGPPPHILEGPFMGPPPYGPDGRFMVPPPHAREGPFMGPPPYGSNGPFMGPPPLGQDGRFMVPPGGHYIGPHGPGVRPPLFDCQGGTRPQPPPTNNLTVVSISSSPCISTTSSSFQQPPKNVTVTSKIASQKPTHSSVEKIKPAYSAADKMKPSQTVEKTNTTGSLPTIGKTSNSFVDKDKTSSSMSGKKKTPSKLVISSLNIRNFDKVKFLTSLMKFLQNRSNLKTQITALEKSPLDDEYCIKNGLLCTVKKESEEHNLVIVVPEDRNARKSIVTALVLKYPDMDVDSLIELFEQTFNNMPMEDIEDVFEDESTRSSTILKSTDSDFSKIESISPSGTLVLRGASSTSSDKGPKVESAKFASSSENILKEGKTKPNTDKKLEEKASDSLKDAGTISPATMQKGMTSSVSSKEPVATAEINAASEKSQASEESRNLECLVPPELKPVYGTVDDLSVPTTKNGNALEISQVHRPASTESSVPVSSEESKISSEETGSSPGPTIEIEIPETSLPPKQSETAESSVPVSSEESKISSGKTDSPSEPTAEIRTPETSLSAKQSVSADSSVPVSSEVSKVSSGKTGSPSEQTAEIETPETSLPAKQSDSAESLVPACSEESKSDSGKADSPIVSSSEIMEPSEKLAILKESETAESVVPSEKSVDSSNEPNSSGLSTPFNLKHDSTPEEETGASTDNTTPDSNSESTAEKMKAMGDGSELGAQEKMDTSPALDGEQKKSSGESKEKDLALAKDEVKSASSGGTTADHTESSKASVPLAYNDINVDEAKDGQLCPEKATIVPIDIQESDGLACEGKDSVPKPTVDVKETDSETSSENCFVNLVPTPIEAIGEAPGRQPSATPPENLEESFPKTGIPSTEKFIPDSPSPSASSLQKEPTLNTNETRENLKLQTESKDDKKADDEVVQTVGEPLKDVKVEENAENVIDSSGKLVPDEKTAETFANKDLVDATDRIENVIPEVVTKTVIDELSEAKFQTAPESKDMDAPNSQSPDHKKISEVEELSEISSQNDLSVIPTTVQEVTAEDKGPPTVSSNKETKSDNTEVTSQKTQTSAESVAPGSGIAPTLLEKESKTTAVTAKKIEPIENAEMVAPMEVDNKAPSTAPVVATEHVQSHVQVESSTTEVVSVDSSRKKPEIEAPERAEAPDKAEETISSGLTIPAHLVPKDTKNVEKQDSEIRGEISVEKADESMTGSVSAPVGDGVPKASSSAASTGEVTLKVCETETQPEPMEAASDIMVEEEEPAAAEIRGEISVEKAGESMTGLVSTPAGDGVPKASSPTARTGEVTPKVSEGETQPEPMEAASVNTAEEEEAAAAEIRGEISVEKAGDSMTGSVSSPAGDAVPKASSPTARTGEVTPKVSETQTQPEPNKAASDIMVEEEEPAAAEIRGDISVEKADDSMTGSVSTPAGDGVPKASSLTARTGEVTPKVSETEAHPEPMEAASVIMAEEEEPAAADINVNCTEATDTVGMADHSQSTAEPETQLCSPSIAEDTSMKDMGDGDSGKTAENRINSEENVTKSVVVKSLPTDLATPSQVAEEAAITQVKEEPATTQVKEKPATTQVKEAPATTQVKEEPATKLVKGEPAITEVDIVKSENVSIPKRTPKVTFSKFKSTYELMKTMDFDEPKELYNEPIDLNIVNYEKLSFFSSRLKEIQSDSAIASLTKIMLFTPYSVTDEFVIKSGLLCKRKDLQKNDVFIVLLKTTAVYREIVSALTEEYPDLEFTEFMSLIDSSFAYVTSGEIKLLTDSKDLQRNHRIKSIKYQNFIDRCNIVNYNIIQTMLDQLRTMQKADHKILHRYNRLKVSDGVDDSYILKYDLVCQFVGTIDFKVWLPASDPDQIAVMYIVHETNHEKDLVKFLELLRAMFEGVNAYLVEKPISLCSVCHPPATANATSIEKACEQKCHALKALPAEVIFKMRQIQMASSVFKAQIDLLTKGQSRPGSRYILDTSLLCKAMTRGTEQVYRVVISPSGLKEVVSLLHTHFHRKPLSEFVLFVNEFLAVTEEVCKAAFKECYMCNKSKSKIVDKLKSPPMVAINTAKVEEQKKSSGPSMEEIKEPTKKEIKGSCKGSSTVSAEKVAKAKEHRTTKKDSKETKEPSKKDIKGSCKGSPKVSAEKVAKPNEHQSTKKDSKETAKPTKDSSGKEPPKPSSKQQVQNSTSKDSMKTEPEPPKTWEVKEKAAEPPKTAVGQKIRKAIMKDLRIYQRIWSKELGDRIKYILRLVPDRILSDVFHYQRSCPELSESIKHLEKTIRPIRDAKEMLCGGILFILKSKSKPKIAVKSIEHINYALITKIHSEVHEWTINKVHGTIGIVFDVSPCKEEVEATIDWFCQKCMKPETKKKKKVYRSIDEERKAFYIFLKQILKKGTPVKETEEGSRKTEEKTNQVPESEIHQEINEDARKFDEICGKELGEKIRAASFPIPETLLKAAAVAQRDCPELMEIIERLETSTPVKDARYVLCGGVLYVVKSKKKAMLVKIHVKPIKNVNYVLITHLHEACHDWTVNRLQTIIGISFDVSPTREEVAVTVEWFCAKCQKPDTSSNKKKTSASLEEQLKDLYDTIDPLLLKSHDDDDDQDGTIDVTQEVPLTDVRAALVKLPNPVVSKIQIAQVQSAVLNTQIKLLENTDVPAKTKGYCLVMSLLCKLVQVNEKLAWRVMIPSELLRELVVEMHTVYYHEMIQEDFSDYLNEFITVPESMINEVFTSCAVCMTTERRIPTLCERGINEDFLRKTLANISEMIEFVLKWQTECPAIAKIRQGVQRGRPESIAEYLLYKDVLFKVCKSKSSKALRPKIAISLLPNAMDEVIRSTHAFYHSSNPNQLMNLINVSFDVTITQPSLLTEKILELCKICRKKSMKAHKGYDSGSDVDSKAGVAVIKKEIKQENPDSAGGDQKTGGAVVKEEVDLPFTVKTEEEEEPTPRGVLLLGRLCDQVIEETSNSSRALDSPVPDIPSTSTDATPIITQTCSILLERCEYDPDIVVHVEEGTTKKRKKSTEKAPPKRQKQSKKIIDRKSDSESDTSPPKRKFIVYSSESETDDSTSKKRKSSSSSTQKAKKPKK